MLFHFLPQIVMPDFGALGYPAEPQLERRCICREIFTLDKWTSMTAYGADQGAPAGPEHPDSTSRAARGATAEPSPSSEPRIAISIFEYRGLCHTFQALATSQSILTQQMTALRAHQEQIIATQTQHTAIEADSAPSGYYHS
ncbi:hypothetical protein CK203_102747 [Vitis vinifera]|uniref:Uncharacterized protein n=1 Tax=Vitis vinifera TaxID=29760 RepID=A0A438FFC1_VITVI|nr:hypothetical protein CK203_102747 [Vitis vinifera]